MATPRSPWLLLVPFFLFSVLSLASPTAVDSPKPRSTAEPLNCSSKFSGDYYGLGVRLGIYFTWLTSWLANTFVEDEIAGALDANSIFLLALLVAIFKGTAVTGPEKLAYIDGLVLMQLCAGYLFGILSMWGYRTSHYYREGPKAVLHYGRVGTHCRLLLVTAISIYGIWFWTYGIRYDLGHGLNRVTDENGNPRPAECYPVYVFFFAKLNVLHGIRIFYTFTSIGTALYYGTMLLVAVAERIRHLIQVISKEKGHEKRQTLNYETGLTQEQLNFLFKFNRIYTLVWLILSAVTVELTLNWNHSTSVLGPYGNISYPAQLLPLMIGSLSFVRICWLIFQRRWSPPSNGCCDENGPSKEKLGEMPRPPDTPAGLGLLPRDPTNAGAGEYDDATIARSRSRVKRYMIAYLPWLSQFEFWKNPKGHNPLRSSLEEDGYNYRDTSLTGIQTSYKPVDNTDLHKDVDFHVRSVPSSTNTSPMIDMKSPTSAATSPMVTYKS